MAERARIVLACLRGKRNDEVASEIGVRPNTVGRWRHQRARRAGMAVLWRCSWTPYLVYAARAIHRVIGDAQRH